MSSHARQGPRSVPTAARRSFLLLTLDNGHALAQGATCSVVAVPRSDQLARVAVPPETWMAFRQAALGQGVSVAAYLGRLVEREVKRRTDRTVAGVSLDAPEPDQALVALTEV